MQTHPVGLARGDRHWRHATESSEGAVTVESLQILSRRDQQLRGVLSADAAALQQVRSTSLNECRELTIDAGDLLVEELHSTAQLSKRELGCLEWFAQALEVGSQCPRPIDAVASSASRLDPLAQLSRRRDQHVTDLQERDRAGLDRRFSREFQQSDGLDIARRVFGPGARFAREHLARGHLGVDGVVLAPSGPSGAMRRVDLEDVDLALPEEPRETGRIGTGALDADALDGAQCGEPRLELAVAGRGGGEALVAENRAGDVQHRGLVGLLV